MTPSSLPLDATHETPPTDLAVSVSGLAAGYGTAASGGVPVLRSTDLAVRCGEVLAVLGPSGCGKTTLLRVLAGLHPADAGTIDLDGRRVTEGRRAVPPEHRGVGLVPQESALFPHRDVAGNIAFGLRSRRKGRPRMDRDQRRRRVAELLDLVGLAGYERRYPDELSGGERQRIALARALAPRPSVVLLDEAFGALDASLRSQLRADVREILHRSAATAILVTHDQDEALSMADRIAIMRAGRIVQTGAPSTVYSRPVDIWTARFLGQCCVLDATSDGALVTCALGVVPSAVAAGPVRVIVRPEQVRLAPEPRAADPVSAVVVGAEYRGHSTLYRLRLHGSDDILLAQEQGSTGHPAGTRLRVSLRGPVHVIPRFDEAVPVR